MSADPVQNAYSVLSKVLKDGLGAAGHVQRLLHKSATRLGCVKSACVQPLHAC